MEQAARAAGIVDNIADPDVSPTRDVELGRSPYAQRARSASRASLPLSHRRSFSTIGGRKSRAASTRSRAGSTVAATELEKRLQNQQAEGTIGTAVTTGESDPNRTNIEGDGGIEDDEDVADDIPWGPEHPCFPHPNPHVPLASPLHQATRVIRVKRDWMVAGDLAPTFTTLYPEILDWFPCLSETAFKELIKELNRMLQAAFSPWDHRSWLDAILGLATGWLWDDAGRTKAKAVLADAERFLETWNTEHGAADGVRIIPLRRTGYLSLDIQIPDPHIVDADDLATEADATTEADVDAETDMTRSRDASQSRATSGSMLARQGSGRSSPSAVSRRGGPGRDGGIEPVVPPIPTEYLQEGAALAITMGGFRNSTES